MSPFTYLAGMLPIHLAFGFGASENVLAFLLEPFPTSINERGLGSRFPYECCELGPNKARGQVFRIVADQVSSRVRAEMDKEWRDVCNNAQQSIGIQSPIHTSEKTLTEVMLELIKDRKELELIKKQQHIRTMKSSNANNTHASSVSSPVHGSPRKMAPQTESLPKHKQQQQQQRNWATRSITSSLGRRKKNRSQQNK
jgi:hypothetical protein